MKIVALAHPLYCCWCAAKRTTIQKWSRISGKTAKESGEKGERGYKAYINGKATSSLRFGMRCHGLHEGQSPCAFVCVGTREVNRTPQLMSSLGPKQQQAAAFVSSFAGMLTFTLVKRLSLACGALFKTNRTVATNKPCS